MLVGPGGFRDLVAGRRRGPAAAIARAALAAAEIPYTAAVRWRNYRYDSGRAACQHAAVPVVSVGNITLGGTGKTPTVEWLARWFAQQQLRVGIVSRGYGARPGEANDEALELARKLPNVPHVLDRDRSRGARLAVEQHGCQLLLLDDGFQHRRLARDLDIVLIDALEPFGFGRVFPRGTLREPLTGWSRANVLMLTRADLVDTDQRRTIETAVRRYAPGAAWVEATHAPRALTGVSRAREPLSTLEGRPVAAFCGIGNPAGFRHALARCNYRVQAMREFADHFAYAPADIAALAEWADALKVDAVVCTDKDLVKIGASWSARTPLWALTAELEILRGGEHLQAALLPLARRAAIASEKLAN